jgi:hypothetical protein
MEPVLVECTVSAGMFSTEVLVKISVDSSLKSFYVDSSLIKDLDGKKYVEARRSQKVNGHSKVLLPSETFEDGQRWVDLESNTVRQANLV